MGRALVISEIGKPVALEDRPLLRPAADEVVVDLRAAALNHRDIWILQGAYPGIQLPVVPGSDGAGAVAARGDSVRSLDLDREVIINPSFDWGDSEAHQGKKFSILGMPRDGTFAEQIVVPASQIAPKPEHLDWNEAAALPLAGLTAYRALFSRAKATPGDRILVTGIGGGVALFALQYAVALGAHVYVTSSSEEKRSRALELGAQAAYDYTDPDWPAELKQATGGIDIAIDGAGGATYANLIELAAPGARIVNYGATAGLPEAINLRSLFFKQLNLLGSTMGSPSDFSAMVAFVAKHQIHPIVDQIFPLEHGAAAMQRMHAGEQFGKIVLTCA